MRLKVVASKAKVHGGVVSSVTWTPSSELLSSGDDGSLCRWSRLGDDLGSVAKLKARPTRIAAHPGNRREDGSDVVVVGCSDGLFRFVGRGGREEKRQKAHQGAILALRWNYDGSALATGGEDGGLKIWSRGGMLRSTLVSAGKPVYALTWSPSGDSVLYASGKDLVIRPLQPNAKPTTWKAHDGAVLAVDWSPIARLIVSGGEDCRCRVWDAFGRLLYKSSPLDHSITSVRWSPHGTMFALGAYNGIRLCDERGWSHSWSQVDCGSVYDLAWTPDGTEVAGAGGAGFVCFGHVVDRRLSWKNYEVTLTEDNRLRVMDVLTEHMEELDLFRDRVIILSISFDHLVVATATQCHVYPLTQLHAPSIFDVKGVPSVVLQAEKHFLLVDAVSGIQVFTYEGRFLIGLNPSGLSLELLNTRTLSVSGDAIALLDKGRPNQVMLFDVLSGRALGDPIKHSVEIAEVALSQIGGARKALVIVDINRDLWLTPIPPAEPELVKLASMVTSVAWNDSVEMLAAVADGRFVVWYFPSAAYVHRDLVPMIRESKDASEAGGVVSFLGTTCTLRREDGALVTAGVSPFASILHKHFEGGEWEQAIRLCRFVKENLLWSCLAAMAMYARQLDAAEVAFAGIEEVDKLQFVLHAKEIPSKEGREAELALFCGKVREAESILLQAGLLYRAIKMHIRLFQWDRALELAVRHKTHVDTVLAYRARHLKDFQRDETNQRFLQYADKVEIDWQQIKEKIHMEKEREAQGGIQ